MFNRIRARIRARIRSWRAAYPWLDHAFRAYDRNTEVMGTQLAAAITYFGFLSFFPLLALGFSLAGFISEIYPNVQGDVTRAVEAAFPSLVGDGAGQINIQDIIDARASAGIIALLGLAYAGLGWLDALRDGLRGVFGTSDVKISFVKKKLVDVVVLVVLGLALLVSVVVTSLATEATTFVLDHVGLDETPVAIGMLKVISVLLAVAADTVLFAIVLSRLSGANLTWRQVRSGALLAAVGFEVLKLLGTFLIGRTTQNPIYATFGVVVGLLVWMNFVSRLTIFAAAWTATRPDAREPADLGLQRRGTDGS
jgi:membrane protein